MAVDSTGGSFALDVNAVSKLKYSAHQQADGGLDKTAKQFEAMFLKQMLSSMRDAIPKSDLMSSSASDQYQDMMDAQWSQTLAQRGVGLADMLTRQLGNDHQTGPAASDTLASIERAAPKALAASDSLEQIRAQREAAGTAKASSNTASPQMRMADGPSLVDNDHAAPLLSLGQTAGVDIDADTMRGYARDFVERLGSAAESAADKTGLSSQLILAQAALETGWGRHEITTDAGQRSHNVFNIKATGWDGESTDVTTHEYSDGIKQRTRDGFRVYDSYDQAFDDYARLIGESPRYASARDADSPEAAAQALQDSGYATDPRYADKLVSIMSQIPATTNEQGGLFAGPGGQVVDLNARADALMS